LKRQVLSMRNFHRRAVADFSNQATTDRYYDSIVKKLIEASVGGRVIRRCLSAMWEPVRVQRQPPHFHNCFPDDQRRRNSRGGGGCRDLTIGPMAVRKERHGPRRVGENTNTLLRRPLGPVFGFPRWDCCMRCKRERHREHEYYERRERATEIILPGDSRMIAGIHFAPVIKVTSPGFGEPGLHILVALKVRLSIDEHFTQIEFHFHGLRRRFNCLRLDGNVVVGDQNLRALKFD